MAIWPYLMMDQPLNNSVCGYFPELHVAAIIPSWLKYCCYIRK